MGKNITFQPASKFELCTPGQSSQFFWKEQSEAEHIGLFIVAQQCTFQRTLNDEMIKLKTNK